MQIQLSSASQYSFAKSQNNIFGSGTHFKLQNSFLAIHLEILCSLGHFSKGEQMKVGNQSKNQMLYLSLCSINPSTSGIVIKRCYPFPAGLHLSYSRSALLISWINMKCTYSMPALFGPRRSQHILFHWDWMPKPHAMSKNNTMNLLILTIKLLGLWLFSLSL